MRTAVGSPLNCQLCHRRRLPPDIVFPL
uniref:Uncharacterized protein n=1 Tax=Anguilla anguilla TaxID=7936 RepID=A0A0E9R0H6_ANGAN